MKPSIKRRNIQYRQSDDFGMISSLSHAPLFR
jgi:hypothetical protein